MSARYIVHRDDEALEVTITEEGDGYRIELGNEVLFVDSRSVGGGTIRSLLIGDRSYESGTMVSRDGVDVYLSGDVFRVRVTDELWARAAGAVHAGLRGDEEVTSPMPGAVVQISVAVGQSVAPGETVAVVEAMKMQNEIAAVRGGKVHEIRAQVGEVVDQGTVLILLRVEEAVSNA